MDKNSKDKLIEDRKTYKDIFKEKEQNNPFLFLSGGIASVVVAYFLSFNMYFWHESNISYIINIVLIVLLLLVGVFVFIKPTIEYYFSRKKEFFYISFGVLLIPCNFMWYKLFPNIFTKFGIIAVLFWSITYILTGFFQLFYKIYDDYKNKEKLEISKLVLSIICEIVAVFSTVIQFVLVL